MGKGEIENQLTSKAFYISIWAKNKDAWEANEWNRVDWLALDTNYISSERGKRVPVFHEP